MERFQSSCGTAESILIYALSSRILHTLASAGKASPPHTFPSWAGGGAPLLPASGQDNSRVTSNHKAWEQPDWTTDDKFRSNRSLARNSVLTQTLALLVPSQRNRLPSSDLSARQAPGPSPAAPGGACTVPRKRPLKDTRATATLHHAGWRQAFTTTSSIRSTATSTIRDVRTTGSSSPTSFPRRPAELSFLLLSQTSLCGDGGYSHPGVPRIAG